VAQAFLPVLLNFDPTVAQEGGAGIYACGLASITIGFSRCGNNKSAAL
jgi:hypothetical protein